LDYVDNNRSRLTKLYPSFEKYNANFQVTQDMMEAVVKAGEKEKITRDQESINFVLPLFKKELKALIARTLFDGNSFYQIYNQDDPGLTKALELCRDQQSYNPVLHYK
jgi:carboxyl-terminal processing protease